MTNFFVIGNFFAIPEIQAVTRFFLRNLWRTVNLKFFYGLTVNNSRTTCYCIWSSFTERVFVFWSRIKWFHKSEYLYLLTVYLFSKICIFGKLSLIVFHIWSQISLFERMESQRVHKMNNNEKNSWLNLQIFSYCKSVHKDAFSYVVA